MRELLVWVLSPDGDNHLMACSTCFTIHIFMWRSFRKKIRPVNVPTVGVIKDF